MATKKDDVRVYYVELNNGTAKKVTVPSSWKVTFGNVSPGNKNNGPGGALCLRFYEGSANNQRMVITNVESFRDMSIPIEEKRVSTKQQVLSKRTPQGDKNVIVEGRVEEWVNPDSPDEQGSLDNGQFFSMGDLDTKRLR